MIYKIITELLTIEDDERKINEIYSIKKRPIATPFSKAAVDRLIKFNIPAPLKLDRLVE